MDKFHTLPPMKSEPDSPSTAVIAAAHAADVTQGEPGKSEIGNGKSGRMPAKVVKGTGFVMGGSK